MANLLRKLFGFENKQDISNVDVENFKAEIINKSKKNIADIVKINKRFRVIISKGELEITIKEIDDITKGK